MTTTLRIEFEDATLAAVERVFALRSAISDAEFKSPDTVRDLYARSIDDCQVMRIGGEAVMIIGHIAEPMPGYRAFWFICTEKYWQAGLPAIRASIAWLQRAAIEWQGFAFRSYSFSTHPDAGRWFNLLGFKPAGRVADCQVFVLRG